MESRIIIRFFGVIAEKVGKTEQLVPREEILNLGVHEFLDTNYPEIVHFAYSVAVDQELNGQFNEISKEIAVFPPFAGG